MKLKNIITLIALVSMFTTVNAQEFKIDYTISGNHSNSGQETLTATYNNFSEFSPVFVVGGISIDKDKKEIEIEVLSDLSMDRKIYTITEQYQDAYIGEYGFARDIYTNEVYGWKLNNVDNDPWFILLGKDSDTAYKLDYNTIYNSKSVVPYPFN